MCCVLCVVCCVLCVVCCVLCVVCRVSRQIEVAVLLYDSMINNDSFHLILNEFEEPADRDNICHRLRRVVGPDGILVPAKKS